MTDTPIYTIDLDDGAFKEFAETFRRFQDQAAKIGEQWRASDAIIAEALKNLEHMSAPHVDGEGAKEFAEHIDRSFFSWGGIASRAKVFGASVHDATLSLGKWSGLTGIFSGLVAAGGFYGIARTAANVANARTNAMQLGSSVGGVAAARSAFGRLGNVDSVMGGLAGALHSVQAMAPLFALLGPEAEKLRGGDAADAFAAILPKLKEMADKESPANMRERLEAMGLTRLGIGVETIKMLKGMSQAEIDDMLKSYRENRERLNPTDAAARSLQEFTSTLQFAQAKMGVMLGSHLVHLTPIIERIAKSFSDLTEKLLAPDSPFSKGLDKLNQKFLGFADWMQSEEFNQSVDQFVAKVEESAALFFAFAPRKKDGASPNGGGGVATPGNEYGRWRHDGWRTPQPRQNLTPWGPSVPMPGGGGNTPHSSGSIPTPGHGETAHELARRIQAARPDLESEQCVALAKAMVGSHGSVRDWRRGEGAMAGNLQPGTPVATFLDRQGRPSMLYDGGQGVGAPGNHTTHAGVFESYIRDRSGQIIGINIIEQFKGSHGQHRRAYYNRGFGTGNAGNYHAILDRRFSPLGGARNPMAHPQTTGAQNHVEIHDHSDGGSRVAVASARIGPHGRA